MDIKSTTISSKHLHITHDELVEILKDFCTKKGHDPDILAGMQVIQFRIKDHESFVNGETGAYVLLTRVDEADIAPTNDPVEDF